MLDIRLNCENCNKALANDSLEAMICSYECTFCKACVDIVLKNVCPNCGGGFEKRPIRPKNELIKNPPRIDKIYKPVLFNTYLEVNKNIEPKDR
mgnify:CR=1 FL=1